ncbi:unnamed protein product [Ectocarpus sp. 12 AP-2014]
MTEESQQHGKNQPQRLVLHVLHILSIFGSPCTRLQALSPDLSASPTLKIPQRAQSTHPSTPLRTGWRNREERPSRSTIFPKERKEKDKKPSTPLLASKGRIVPDSLPRCTPINSKVSPIFFLLKLSVSRMHSRNMRHRRHNMTTEVLPYTVQMTQEILIPLQIEITPLVWLHGFRHLC